MRIVFLLSGAITKSQQDAIDSVDSGDVEVISNPNLADDYDLLVYSKAFEGIDMPDSVTVEEFLGAPAPVKKKKKAKKLTTAVVSEDK